MKLFLQAISLPPLPDLLAAHKDMEAEMNTGGWRDGCEREEKSEWEVSVRYKKSRKKSESMIKVHLNVQYVRNKQGAAYHQINQLLLTVTSKCS